MARLRSGIAMTSWWPGDSFSGDFVAFDPMPSGGSGAEGPFCTGCRAPIATNQRSVRVDFNTDPHGHRGLGGLYHEHRSRPFASLAHVINMNWFGRF
jgi:hypothetical protein